MKKRLKLLIQAVKQHHQAISEVHRTRVEVSLFNSSSKELFSQSSVKVLHHPFTQYFSPLIKISLSNQDGKINREFVVKQSHL